MSSNVVAINSVSPDNVELCIARSYLPNFNKSGTCNDAFGSNSSN